MRGHESLKVIGSDKNLGQCIIERATYMELVYHQHPSDSSCYRQTTELDDNKLVYNAMSNFFDMARIA